MMDDISIGSATFAADLGRFGKKCVGMYAENDRTILLIFEFDGVDFARIDATGEAICIANKWVEGEVLNEDLISFLARKGSVDSTLHADAISKFIGQELDGTHKQSDEVIEESDYWRKGSTFSGENGYVYSMRLYAEIAEPVPDGIIGMTVGKALENGWDGKFYRICK